MITVRTTLKTFAALAFAASMTACGGGDDDEPAVLVVDAATGATTIDAAALAATLATYPLQTLSDAERASLLAMREEEQLAHDVYAASARLWPQPIFDNIAASETTHAQAVAALLERYGVPDPMAALPEGTFATPAFQALYDAYVATSRTSVVAALKVGAEIEELDIRDIAVQKTVVDNADITMVYDHLLRGSRNHLRALVRVLATLGETYTPQYLSQAEFDAIVSSPIETGR